MGWKEYKRLARVWSQYRVCLSACLHAFESGSGMNLVLGACCARCAFRLSWVMGGIHGRGTEALRAMGGSKRLWCLEMSDGAVIE